MWASILPIDCQGCKRGRPPSFKVTRIIMINLVNIGSLSTLTITEQKHISIATDYRPWTPDSSYVFDGTLPCISEILRNCNECFLKFAGNCCVFLYFMCNGYNLNQFLNLFDNNYERNDHLIVKLFHKIFLPSKN